MIFVRLFILVLGFLGAMPSLSLCAAGKSPAGRTSVPISYNHRSPDFNAFGADLNKRFCDVYNEVRTTMNRSLPADGKLPEIKSLFFTGKDFLEKGAIFYSLLRNDDNKRDPQIKKLSAILCQYYGWQFLTRVKGFSFVEPAQSVYCEQAFWKLYKLEPAQHEGVTADQRREASAYSDQFKREVANFVLLDLLHRSQALNDPRVDLRVALKNNFETFYKQVQDWYQGGVKRHIIDPATTPKVLVERLCLPFHMRFNKCTSHWNVLWSKLEYASGWITVPNLLAAAGVGAAAYGVYRCVQSGNPQINDMLACVDQNVPWLGKGLRALQSLLPSGIASATTLASATTPAQPSSAVPQSAATPAPAAAAISQSPAVAASSASAAAAQAAQPSDNISAQLASHVAARSSVQHAAFSAAEKVMALPQAAASHASGRPRRCYAPAPLLPGQPALADTVREAFNGITGSGQAPMTVASQCAPHSVSAVSHAAAPAPSAAPTWLEGLGSFVVHAVTDPVFQQADQLVDRATAQAQNIVAPLNQTAHRAIEAVKPLADLAERFNAGCDALVSLLAYLADRHEQVRVDNQRFSGPVLPRTVTPVATAPIDVPRYEQSRATAPRVDRAATVAPSTPITGVVDDMESGSPAVRESATPSTAPSERLETPLPVRAVGPSWSTALWRDGRALVGRIATTAQALLGLSQADDGVDIDNSPLVPARSDSAASFRAVGSPAATPHSPVTTPVVVRSCTRGPTPEVRAVSPVQPAATLAPAADEVHDGRSSTASFVSAVSE